MNNSTSVAGSPAGTEAAMNELVAHIAANYADPNAILAAVLFATLEHFLGQQPGADGFAGALNQRLAALPGDRVWQLAQIPRTTLDNAQAAIAAAMREAGQTPRH